MDKDVSKRDQSWWLVVAVVVALGLLIVLGYSLLQREKEPESLSDRAPATVQDRQPSPPEEPQYPIEEETREAAEESVAQAPAPQLPALDESDASFEDALEELLATDEIAIVEVRDSVIRKIVATIDGLEREDLAERIRPVDSLAGKFLVSGQVDGDLYILSPANYERYNAVVDALAAIDMSQAAALYRRYYPLFQQAYSELGYPDAYFNDRLVAVIDHLLKAPDVADPIRLVRPHVLYQYENPVLEDLSSGQKLLIRMGPDNRETVKTVLRQFRARITGASQGADAGAEQADTQE